jgi:ArsR family metal-binding transcriptional regulator
MNEDTTEVEITKMNSELMDVLAELKELKKKEQKNQDAKKEAMVFLEKAEKVISLAEHGKLKITDEQKSKIIQTLLKIRGLFKL